MLSRTFFRHSEPDSETVKMNNRDGEWRGFRIFFEIGIEAKSDSTLDEFLCHGVQGQCQPPFLPVDRFHKSAVKIIKSLGFLYSSFAFKLTDDVH